MQILSNPISALNVRESPKSSCLKETRVEELDGDVRF